MGSNESKEKRETTVIRGRRARQDLQVQREARETRETKATQALLVSREQQEEIAFVLRGSFMLLVSKLSPILLVMYCLLQ